MKEFKLPGETPFIAGVLIGAGAGFIFGRYIIAGNTAEKPQIRPLWTREEVEQARAQRSSEIPLKREGIDGPNI